MPRPAASEGSGDLLNTKSNQRPSIGNAVMTRSRVEPAFTMVTRSMAREAKLREMKSKCKAWQKREKYRKHEALPLGLRIQRELLFKEMKIEEDRLCAKSTVDVRELKDFQLDFSRLEAFEMDVSSMKSFLRRNRTWPAKSTRRIKITIKFSSSITTRIITIQNG